MECNFPSRKTSKNPRSEEPTSSLDSEFLNQFTWRDVHNLEDEYFIGNLIQISVFYESIPLNKLHDSVNFFDTLSENSSLIDSFVCSKMKHSS